MRRGQVALFIIIGIIIVVIAGVGYYLLARSSAGVTQPVPVRITSAADAVARVQAYVGDCLRSSIAPLAFKMAAQGGTLSQRGDIFDRSHTRVDAWGVESAAKGTVNQARTREQMEREMALVLQQSSSVLMTCLAALKDPAKNIVPGGSVEAGDAALNVTIDPLEMTVRLVYPVGVTFEGVDNTLKDFVTVVPLPLGRLVQIGQDIVNDEARHGSFSKEQWLLANGDDVLIQKERPYPDMIYNLSTVAPGFRERLVLVFAVKGRDTAGKDVRRLKSPLGCCVMPSLDCRENVDASDCAGTYNESARCGCAQNAKPVRTGCCRQTDGTCAAVTGAAECDGTFIAGDVACAKTACANMACDDLSYYYDDAFGGMTQGESWCTADTVTGFGTDFVGSRHYLHSCIDGKEYVEPCRDYREEICVNGDDPLTGKSRAACKVNRWYDCAQQKEQSDCEDIGRRDCWWIPSVTDGEALVKYAKMKCVPFVPPGFAVWRVENKAVCSRIQQNPIFDPGPRTQGFNTLHICSRLGDCGNKRNWVGALTKKGYKNPVGKPKEKHYNAFTLKGYSNPVGTSQDVLGHYLKLYAFQRQIYGYVAGVTLDDAMDASIDASTSIVAEVKKGAIKCKPWVQPPSGECGLCDVDPLRPCSEYRCRTLGKNCRWIEENGEGRCDGSGALSDTKGPLLSLDPAQSAIAGVSATQLPGDETHARFKLQPVLPGNQKVVFTVLTDEDATCVASPISRTFDIESLADGDGVVDQMAVLAAFDIPIGGDDPRRHVVAFRAPSSTILNDVARYFPEITMYIYCEDEAGNPSVNEMSLSVALSDQTMPDEMPPEVTYAHIVDEPDQGTLLRVALSKPVVECKAGDASAMTLLSGCAPGALDLSYESWAPNVGDSTCEVPVPDPVPSVIQCKDEEGRLSAVAPITRE